MLLLFIFLICNLLPGCVLAGRMFVTGDDLRRWSGLKGVDTATRAALTLLRVAHKCQEIRGPGALVRYAVPQ